MAATSQQKAFSTAILTLLMLNIVFWGAIKPTIDTILKTKQTIKTYKTTLKELQEKNERLTELSQQYENLRPTLKKFSYYFPYNSDYSFLVDNLHRVLNSYNFRLSSVKFSEKINKKIAAEMAKNYDYLLPTTFSCNIKGPSTTLSQFMRHWENTPFHPKIITLSYTPKNSLTLDYSIVFVVYKFKYNLNE